MTDDADKPPRQFQQAPSAADRPDTPAAAAGGRPLAPGIQAHLGQQLKAVYAEIANQPVPDRFAQLLDELERKQRAAPAKPPAHDA